MTDRDADGFHLDGAVAVVTGAGRGIGEAVALELAAAGTAVGLVSRTPGDLERVAARTGALGSSAAVIAADIGDPDQVARAAGRAAAVLGPIDLLVNNAATISPLGPTSEVDPDRWEAAVRTNLFGPVRLTRAVLPAMLARGRGMIVNLSSGVVAAPPRMVGGNAYVSSKGALEAHTLNLAGELDGTGVSANVFRPGAVDTAMQSSIRDRDPDEVGTALHARFVEMHQQGLLAPRRSAEILLERLRAGGNGQIWDAGQWG